MTKEPKSPYKYLGWVTGLGMTMIFSMVICLSLGLYLDARFHTSPWCSLIFLILGMGGGAWSVYKGIMAEMKSDE